MEHPAALLGAPIPWTRLQRILVVRPDNLGDVLLAGPAIRALAAAAPEARVDLLAAPAGAAAGRLLPGVGRVLVASVSWQHAGAEEVPLSADTDLVAEIAAGGYDAALVLTSFSQSPWPAGYLCRQAGVPVRVGLSKEFGGAGLTHWVPAPSDDLHQVDRSLHLLDRVGVPAVGRDLRVDLPPVAVRNSRALLAGLGLAAGTPYAMVLPGASCGARRYPAERFAEVARRLRDHGLVPVVVGTAKERPIVDRVAAGLAGALPLAGTMDVATLAAAVASSRVVVCNNSGAMHLAEALRAPVVVLFAGTEQRGQYEPRFAAASVLTVPVPCSPCRQFTCPYRLECLDVPPGQVADRALALAGA